MAGLLAPRGMGTRKGDEMKKPTTTAAIVALLALGASMPAFAEEDPFYLPQKEQPFDGKVETRIGPLEFDNQYPSKESMTTLLESIDFHGATQSFLWGIPIASFANLQHYLHDVFKFDQVDLMETSWR